MSVIQQSMLDYSAKKALHSSPLYIKILPLNNQTSFTLSTTAVYGPVQFVVPSKCINFGRSYLSMDVTMPAQNANFAYVQANLWTLFYRLNLVGQSTNTQLLDLSPVDRFASMLIPLTTRDLDLQNKSNTSVAATNTATTISTLYTTPGYGQTIPFSEVAKNSQIANYDGNGNDTGTAYYGLKKLYVTPTAVNTAGFFTVVMPFKSLPFNIMSLDKVMYYGSEQLELNVYFNSTNRWSWYSISNTIPSTVPLVGASNVTIANLAIYLYTEQDAEVIKGLVDKTMTSGYSINFAYPLITRQALSGSSQSVNTQLTRGYGKSVLFIGTSWFNNTSYSGTTVYQSNGETLNTAQDHSITMLTCATGAGLANVYAGGAPAAGGLCPTGYFSALTYQSQIDSINILTNNNYNVNYGEHFLYNKENLYGCAVQSMNQYNIEFCHIDNFTGSAVCDIDQTVEDGLSLEDYRQHQIQILGTTAGIANTVNIAWYIVYVCQRTLNISSQGLLVT